MRAVPSRGRAADRAPRVSSTATLRLESRVPAHTRAAQRRSSPRDVVLRLRSRDARWVEPPPRRRDAPRARAAPFVPDGDAAPPRAPRTALVVGAGPAGALAALHLSRLGWRVRVLDASAAPLGDAPTENAVVSKRGLAALRDAGVALSAERDGATTLEGAVRYRVQHNTVVNESVVAAAHRTTQFKGSVVVKRGALARAIRRATLKPPPPLRSDGDGESESDSKKTNVSFEFGKTLRFVNLDSKLARFEVHETKTEESVAYDLLVGADGSASATRAALENEGVLRCERNSNGLYAKTVRLPPEFFQQTRKTCLRPFENDSNDGGTGRLDPTPTPTPTPTVAESRAKETTGEKDDWRVRRHAWEHTGVVDAFAVPNTGKDVSGNRVDEFELTLVAPLSRWKRVRTASDAETFLDDVAPGAFGCPDGAVAAAYKAEALDAVRDDACLIENGVSTTCSRLTRRDGSAVLVGDAAHSAWPTLGQNMDATLETSAYLGAALAKARTRERPKGSRVAARKRENQSENSTPIWSDENTDAGVNDLDFDVKTALAVYFEEGRAPAARAFVRLCETGFGSGDVGVKRRFENVCFFAKLGALTLLRKLAPFLFDAPALTKMDDPSWGYDDVEDETRRETGTVFAVVACVVSLFCATRRFGARSVAASLGTVARAVLVGDAGGGEGLAVLVLGSVAALTAAFRLAEKRRAEKRRARKGNATRRDASA